MRKVFKIDHSRNQAGEIMGVGKFTALIKLNDQFIHNTSQFISRYQTLHNFHEKCQDVKSNFWLANIEQY